MRKENDLNNEPTNSGILEPGRVLMVALSTTRTATLSLALFGLPAGKAHGCEHVLAHTLFPDSFLRYRENRRAW